MIEIEPTTSVMATTWIDSTVGNAKKDSRITTEKGSASSHVATDCRLFTCETPAQARLHTDQAPVSTIM